MTATETVKTTPLHDEHVALGGRMVEFAGYSLPVQYKGVIAESKAVREGAGMFDVSHMARLEFHGPRTLEFLEWATTNDVAKLTAGQGQYSMLPNAQGGTVDDIILYRLGDDRFKMVVNAANHGKDVAHLQSLDTSGVEMRDYTNETAMIAVQGPRATEIVAALAGPDKGRVTEAAFFDAFDCTVAGVPCFAARSGYTGEDGYELQCAASDAPRLWKALLEAGVEPCGLGSRDTLRVEAGLPLYGHELSDDLSPIAAGLGWVVSKTKSFLGSEKIQNARKEGTPSKLQGVRLEGKRLPQPGMSVMVEGREVGKVSSGVFSPLLDCGIAFAFLEPTVALETSCHVEVRGTLVPGQVVNKRFFKRG
ncbi:MAG: glycine cleavage system aminomethyltransferase GcvT [Fimbriimonadaceae bacterium]|nr:glycine cleavage system aminomethyltransferase GcvT [Fimbriimonadaceae bacterium]QYK55541.1 MAG: glycine cleavage system aminomethyltransferase GcvT [Fimbriimonadaceae bacterium]